MQKENLVKYSGRKLILALTVAVASVATASAQAAEIPVRNVAGIGCAARDISLRTFKNGVAATAHRGCNERRRQVGGHRDTAEGPFSGRTLR